MKGTIQYLGRGLLVLALCGSVVGCGDDDDSGNDDGGIDGGAGGSGGTGGGGTGGGTDSGTDGGGGTGGGGGTVTPAQCETMATANGSVVQPECLTCLCEADAEGTAACDETCWGLVACIATKCGGDGMDLPCITTECTDTITGGTQAMAVPFDMCGDVCVAPPAGDGGADDGGA